MGADRSDLAARGAMPLTALWIAAARAHESARSDALFEDPFAAALAGTRGEAILAASEAASGGENAFLAIRTRFFDDLLTTSAEHLDQVVLLGAGLDTRAFRLPGLAQVRWFEIDIPALLAEKERALAQLGARATGWRTVVGADLAADWSAVLLHAGFSGERRTAWIAEGLLYYLSPDRVGRLLATARTLSGPGSLFGADTSGSGLLALPVMQSTLRARAAQGLPPPFTTDDPRGLFVLAGWPSVEFADLAQLAITYGRPLETPVWARDPALSRTLRTHLAVARV